jgi:hypothetical protein
MVVLGIVLIALAVLFGVGVSVSSTASTTLEVFGVDFGVAVPTVFFLGLVTGVALMAGLWLTKMGLGRGYRRRKEMRALRAQAATPEITESDPAPVAATDRDEVPAEDRPATEPHTAIDPTDTKQPH